MDNRRTPDQIVDAGMFSALKFFSGKYSVVECGCWEWRASCTRDGYGVFRNRVKSISDSAHRASWRIFYGDIPHGLCVCHRCDNRTCVNPTHLFLGTKKENSQDMVSKGRRVSNPAKGESQGLSKLTENIVRDIRSSLRPASYLAKIFGVSDSLIYQVRSNKIWRHVQ